MRKSNAKERGEREISGGERRLSSLLCLSTLSSCLIPGDCLLPCRPAPCWALPPFRPLVQQAALLSTSFQTTLSLSPRGPPAEAAIFCWDLRLHALGTFENLPSSSAS